MNSDNQNNPEDIKASEVSITSLSIFIALSIGVISFLVTTESILFGYNAVTVSSGMLLLAVSLFFISLEFFILSILHKDHLSDFAFYGSSLYGVGLTSMIVGVSIALRAFGLHCISIIFLALLLVGYSIYYSVRIMKLGLEKPKVSRIGVRAVCFILLIAGFPLLFTLN